MRSLYDTVKSKISTSDIAHRMFNGASWLVIGLAISKVLVLLGGILCAHILGKEQYGQFGMVKSTIGMFLVIGGAGLGVTATKFIAEFRDRDKSHVSSVYILSTLFSLFLAFLIAVLVFLFSNEISIQFLHTANLVSALKMGALILLFTIINVVQSGVLSGFEDFKTISINTLIGSLVEAAGMVAGAHFYGINGAVIGYGIGFVLIALLNHISIQRIFRFREISTSLSLVRREDIKILYNFTLPAAVSTLLAGPTFWVIRTIIVKYCDYGELAIYDVGDQWKIFILFVPSTLTQILLPILSSINKDDSNKFWKVLNVNLLINTSAAFAIAVVVCLVSNVIMGMYGKGFDDPVPLMLLAFSTVFTSTSVVLGNSITSIGKIWVLCAFNIIWSGVAILLSYVFVRCGLKSSGVALALLIAYIENTIVQYIYLKYVKK